MGEGVVLVVALAAGVLATVVARYLRHGPLRMLGAFALGAFGGYFVARGVLEFQLIDLGDPADYRDDWGGPSLAGVLAVHCGPGILVLAGVGWWLRRGLVAKRSQQGRSDCPESSALHSSRR